MSVRTAAATWRGNLAQGNGEVSVGSGTFSGAYSFGSRFEEASGSNPEELIGAAHAGCYSMFLSAILSKAGHVPNSVHTTAKVHLTAGPTISLIELHTEGDVPGIDQATFLEFAQNAKQNCPVSKALASVEMTLDAVLR